MRQLRFCLLFALLMLCACNANTADADMPMPTEQPFVSIIRSPTGVVTTQTSTSEPTVQPTSGPSQIQPTTATDTPTIAIPTNDLSTCTYASSFIEDVTLPDGSMLQPNVVVQKTWRVRNAGSCVWESDAALTLIKGPKFDTPGKVPLGPVWPGEKTDVSITFTTPAIPGVYESYWRLVDGRGKLFGGVLFLKIEVSTSAPPWLTPTSSLAAAVTTPAADTPTPIPSAMPTVKSTSTPVDSEAIGCTDYNPLFNGIRSQASMLGIEVGCAMGAVSEQTGLVQEFWRDVSDGDTSQRLRSLMLSNEDTGTIYVLEGLDTFTYEADVAVYEKAAYNVSNVNYICEAPSVPNGYILPQDSIAKVWCNRQDWRTIGWPRQEHANADLLIQATARGVLIQIIPQSGAVYFLALDLITARGSVQMAP
ncbi:MAG: NBR1-Ig-like domain-containing protein [Anaerolineae bacterium]|nr:NBR1-Ig-like domain-containing protein [Anaerolineae bacterium]